MGTAAGEPCTGARSTGWLSLTEPRTRTLPPTSAVYYEDYEAAHVAGVALLRTGDRGYRSGLDRDGDGIACDEETG
jgi:hypothetical protein